ncbi:hypothetical protein U1Q18_016861 [Sarracenia purpurea var. burkii]
MSSIQASHNSSSPRTEVKETPNNTNGAISCYSAAATLSPLSSSSPPFVSSTGMDFPDMGSLSITPNYGGASSLSLSSPSSSSSSVSSLQASWDFPFMGRKSTMRGLEETHNFSSVNVGRGKKGTDYSDGFGGNSEETIDLNAIASFDEEIKPTLNAGNDKALDNGQSKFCARGHWRPAEDAKLKELVGLYGPQNWNLVAEKLEGRSGKESDKNRFPYGLH